MLDQNTDRMWYVIGAVIIGAALIFIVNSTFPQVFASVGGTFEDKADETMDIASEIVPYAPIWLGKDDVHYSGSVYEVKPYDSTTNTWSFEVDPVITDNAIRGLVIDSLKFAIPYGKSFTILYDIYAPTSQDGVLSAIDINNELVDGSGRAWNGNDNDVRMDRVFNGVQGVYLDIPLTSGVWTPITATYWNKSSDNVLKEDLYDYSTIGIRNKSNSAIKIKIRNIRVVVQ